MKAKDVLRLLQISRSTLARYREAGLITVKSLPNGRFDYDKESVYDVFNHGISREKIIYATDFEEASQIKIFCEERKQEISEIFYTFNWDKDNQKVLLKFRELISKISNKKIKNVFVYDIDTLEINDKFFPLIKILLEENGGEVYSIKST